MVWGLAAWMVLYPPSNVERFYWYCEWLGWQCDRRKVDADGHFHYIKNHQWSLMELLLCAA